VVQELTFIINTLKIILSGSLSLDNIQENDKDKDKGIGKGKVHPRTSHEGPEGE
jgi:hypothetical protein